MPDQVNGTNHRHLTIVLRPYLVLDACGRTLDIAAAATGIALDAARKVSKQQFGIAQRTAAAFSTSVRNFGKAASPADAIGGQAEFPRASRENAFAGSREVATILQQSGEATLALFGKRMAKVMAGAGREAGSA
jgi:phasin family protein